MTSRRQPWRPIAVAALALAAFLGPATASSALWSTSTTTTLSVSTSPVVVAPAPPSGLSCQLLTGKKNVSLGWTTVSGVTYDLVRTGTATPLKSSVTPPVTLTPGDVGMNDASVYVRATNAAGSTLSSQYFAIHVSSDFTTCAVQP